MKDSLGEFVMANGKDLPKKIAVLYSDVKRSYFPTESQYITEKGAEDDAKVVAKHIQNLGIKTHLLPGNSNLPIHLKKIKPDIAINLVDSFKGFENLSSSICGVLEILEIPYTGADILGMSLDTNKFVIKKLLEQNGVPVPRFQLFATPNDPIDPTLRFPLISKLNEIHGAVEITKDAVSDHEKHLRERLKFLITTYKQPALVEEFIVGREVTAILLEGLNKKVYLAEKVFNKDKEDSKYVFSTFEDQWLKKGYESFHYSKFIDPILREYVKKAFDITRMYDYGKFDIRIDQSGRYFFIDSNTNPAFGPKECDVAISVILDIYGISFQEILKRLMLNTVRDAQGKERLPPAGSNENS
ncbi:hypothetical protein COX03_01530 [Candidatus Woesebacteria bacterium CG22_combo_CG10-13_8_21_14_all_39_10]|uniref:ATP-grasp domain-containing protein n=2 Tax=Candidatus Woeseibacteriota TaxID=1752722 RepID=A0A2M7AQS0_9BACT|nr:MAG: hypothetical protein COX03_01530 [Candidatus Woesebacteria bacterium CG22_combo_CG10-13_8_21_14_all_39_10]PIU71929.1 MAG: hypothetical protein COS80_00495 [Candidatus Woesebacteria bacterium CG06_land_8_20_14_3_00_39_27]